MRIPPPGQLRIPRQTLLDDVARRLVARHPEFSAIVRDPADPGWMLLEQAAWMVENLSERLDVYPRHSIQHLLSLMGYEMLEATPALTVALLEVAKSGALEPEDAQATRVFTRPTEGADALEFCVIEPGPVPLLKGRISALYRVSEVDGLSRCGVAPVGSTGASLACFTTSPVPLDAFSEEHFDLKFPLSYRSALRENSKVKRSDSEFEKRWLTYEVLEQKDSAVLRCRISLRAVRSVGSTLSEEDVRGGVVARFPWRPEMFVNNSTGLLPRVALRPEFAQAGITMSFGDEYLKLSAPNGRAGIAIGPTLSEVVHVLAPLENADIQRIYNSFAEDAVVGQNGVAPEKSSGNVARYLTAQGASEIPWLERAVQDGLWDRLRSEDTRFLVELDTANAGMGHQALGTLASNVARLGFVRPWSAEGTRSRGLTAWPLRKVVRGDAGALPAEAGVTLRWTGHEIQESALTTPVLRFLWPELERHELSAPPEALLQREGNGRVMPLSLETVDITISAETDCLVVAVPSTGERIRDIRGVVLNPVLLANAPIVRDGRSHTLESSLQEVASLLWRNIVTRETLSQPASQSLPEAVVQAFGRLPLAEIAIPGRRLHLKNWEGMEISPSQGTVTFNTGEQSSVRLGLKRGEEVELNWYRRTDGARGNIYAGTLDIVEQPPGVLTRVTGVWNPLPGQHGRDPEAIEQATARLFGPSRPLQPVVPADFERWALDILTTTGQSWIVRCWSEAERSLVAADWWVSSQESVPRLDEARQKLVKLGSRALLLSIGRPYSLEEDPEFEPARGRLAAAWERIGLRHPVVESLVIVPLVSLIYTASEGAGIPVSATSPRYALKGLSGKLMDSRRSVRPVPPNIWHYLNAGIVACRSEGR